MDQQHTDKLHQANHMIMNAKNILLITHLRPDGDALSSISAMIDYLIRIKKKHTAYCKDPSSSIYGYIPHSSKIINEKNFSISEFDLVITLDCGSLARTYLEKEIRYTLNITHSTKFIEFDHHPHIDDFSDLEIREPSLSSTAELIYNFYKTNNIPINKNTAIAILTGIVTDTGNFLYPGTTEKTMSIASEMMIHGARFPKIVKNLIQNKSLSSIKLWGVALNNLQINQKYNIAYSVIAQEEVKNFTEERDIFDDIIGFISNLYGVKMIIFLRDEGEEKLKGSLRSNDPHIDVSRLARILGGGGHAKASGFMIHGHIKKTNTGWMII